MPCSGAVCCHHLEFLTERMCRMPQQQDPRAISLQKMLDNWAAKQLSHIPAGSRATLVRNWYAQQGFLSRVAFSPYADQIVAGGAWSLLITLLGQNYSQRVTR